MAHKLVDSYPQKAVLLYSMCILTGRCLGLLWAATTSSLANSHNRVDFSGDIFNLFPIRSHGRKATQIDSHFGPGWLGFGHAFAIEVSILYLHPTQPASSSFFFPPPPCFPASCQGEHDQAMAAYCSASRLMPGCHLPLLCVGIEYMQTNNLRMAMQHIESARSVCGAF
jgi:hypothetical protein